MRGRSADAAGRTFNYLALLATLGKLGRTENEVATHILCARAYAMHGRGFHELRIPPPEKIEVAWRDWWHEAGPLDGACYCFSAVVINSSP